MRNQKIGSKKPFLSTCYPEPFRLGTAFGRFLVSTLIIMWLILPQTVTWAEAPTITINSPASDIWTQSNDVMFDVSITDPSAAYGFIDWEDSLVGWWRAEGNAFDESKSANHGTFIGDATTASGKFGQAFSFDGSGDYVSLGDKPEFDFHKTDSFTLSTWVNKADGFEGGILTKGRGFTLHYNGYRWQFTLGGQYPTYYDSTPQNKWVYIVVVYDASNPSVSMYVDGEHKSGGATAEFTDFSSSSHLGIGRGRYGGIEHNGLIDDVMIFNRALSSGEIKALYNATAQNLITTFSDLDELASYNYNIHAVNNLGEKIESGEKTIIVDVPNSPPIVTLDAPLNPTRSSQTAQQFTISAVDTNADTTLSTATLYWDYGGTFMAEETLALNGDSDTAIFTKTDLTDATITWNCYVTDSNGNGAFAQANHTLIIGQADYYVAPYGDDTNPGTITQPLKTIQRFADNALPGDTCHIRAGTYREGAITPANSGNALANITFKAYQGEKVIISGADPLTGAWTQHDGSIYKTTMNWDLGKGKNQIFVDGKAMLEARWPNAVEDDLMRPNTVAINSGSISAMSATINSTDLTQADGFWDGAIVHAIWNPRYHAATGIVTSYSTGTLEVTLNTRPSGTISYGIFYLIDSYNALDIEKEWYYDPDNNLLYLWAPGGLNPSTLTVEARARQQAFNLNGKSYINIEDIHLFACNITTDYDSHHIRLDGLDVKYVSHYTLIDESSMGVGNKGTQDSGIILAGNNNVIQNSTIDFSAGNGVALIGSNNTVQNCTISNVNYMLTAAASVFAGDIQSRKTENNSIIGNRLYNASRSIIYFDNASNLKVLHNEIYGARRSNWAWDMGYMYAIATDGGGTEIAYNYIHKQNSRGNPMGIYLDNINKNFLIHHNIIDVVGIGLFFNVPSSDNVAYNNTVFPELRVRADTPASNLIIKNNIVGRFVHYRGANPPPPEEIELSNNIYLDSTDPYSVFVDYDNKDFHLIEGSPAIDAGLDLGFTEDFDGNPIPQGSAPDIGAYEYTDSSFLYGDVSGNGTISATDASMAARYAVGLISLTAEQITKAEVTANGTVSATDASWIARKAVDGAIVFPVEQ